MALMKKIKSGVSLKRKRARATSNGRETNPERRAPKADETDDSTLKVALLCASVGLRVTPLHGRKMSGTCTCGNADCDKPGMHPRTEDGVRDATTDSEQVKTFWTKWPNAKVGIVTGRDAGIIAIRVSGDTGGTGLKELQDRHTRLPKTVTIRTSKRRT
jgi:Bifunctional DNA primase/polymerase, N-terminal